jgi:arylsulfatase
MTTSDRPNIVLFITDQQRGDCLSLDGSTPVQTPHIDELGGRGAWFRRAYSACPLCMPARRTLMTGMKPSSHGVVGNINKEFSFPTLPQLLRESGYQTHCVGKMHLWPKRKRYGFDSMDWSDGPYEGDDIGDYGDFLRQHTNGIPFPAQAHGVTLNSWIGGPWHLAERLHFTNWVTDKALDFLQHRDPTSPFFLKVSYFHPHQPVACPEFYYNRYIAMNLPEPVCGDWARLADAPAAGTPVRTRKAHLAPELAKQYRAGYYGCINQIDNQVGRILDYLDLPGPTGGNTMFIFASDHGEMLGDHDRIGKRYPYEQSARIPLVIKFPESSGVSAGQVRDEPVELMDIMPTVLDAAGVGCPDTVDGNSVLPLCREESSVWREYIHGECAHNSLLDPEPEPMQYVTDGKRKFIWYPMQDIEQYFDLEADPKELYNLIGNPEQTAEIDTWRQRLIGELDGRPEEFVDNGELRAVSEITSVLPSAEV